MDNLAADELRSAYRCLSAKSAAKYPTALDTKASRSYSLPFRAEGLKQSKQRPVGSVGVEALLDHQQYGRLTIIVA